MRTYGRTYNADGTYKWVEVQTDAAGYNDAIYLTTLAQCLKLSIGESPFYAQYGIPAQQTILTQVFPDYYVSQTQAQFAPYFASVTVVKVKTPYPQYNVNVVTHQGAKMVASVPL